MLLSLQLRDGHVRILHRTVIVRIKDLHEGSAGGAHASYVVEVERNRTNSRAVETIGKLKKQKETEHMLDIDMRNHPCPHCRQTPHHVFKCCSTTGSLKKQEEGVSGSRPASTVDTCKWSIRVDPQYGWGQPLGQQQSTAGWLAALPVFEPHWQASSYVAFTCPLPHPLYEFCYILSLTDRHANSYHVLHLSFPAAAVRILLPPELQSEA